MTAYTERPAITILVYTDRIICNLFTLKQN